VLELLKEADGSQRKKSSQMQVEKTEHKGKREMSGTETIPTMTKGKCLIFPMYENTNFPQHHET